MSAALLWRIILDHSNALCIARRLACTQQLWQILGCYRPPVATTHRKL